MPDLTAAAFAAHLAPMLCVFAAAFLQSATGFGLVMIASPLLMYFYDPKLVIIIVALVASCGNVAQSLLMRRHTDFALVGWLTLGALVGQPIGLRVYQMIPALWLKLVVSVVILLSLTLMQAFHVHAEIRPRNSLLTGMIAGTSATTTGMSGPPLILYFSHARLAPTEIRAVACTFFAASNILALTAFYLGGVDFAAALGEVPYILPGLALGIAVGYIAAGRVPAKEFRRALYVILVAMCLHTIWGAVRAL
ncbi:MAG: sulfite exporter TauE/SafE family protein [Schwartzia sp.]|nr:sulfite exporter TauE/SafE family protein [Schwartzia sp. (in: firmicutes)]MBR1761707.1 sulfite exporter TauE/SafE family protein [Schwartzia sp. (in: firmicutes)]